MKTVLSLFAVALVLGFTASKAEAHDRNHHRRHHHHRVDVYRPVVVLPPRPVYQEPCYRPQYRPDPCYRPQYYSDPCHEPRHYRRSGFGITFVR